MFKLMSHLQLVSNYIIVKIYRENVIYDLINVYNVWYKSRTV